MTPSDFTLGMHLRDSAGHEYALLDIRTTTFARHSQHANTDLLVRRISDGTERWVWASTAVSMVKVGRLWAVQPEGMRA